MSPEAAVIGLAAALYLADCVALLERGQGIVEARWSRVALAFGSRHYQLRGKAVALLNPFTPFIPAFRTAPLFSSFDLANVRTSKALQAMAPLRLPSLLQFILLFAVLPYCLYRAPGWPFAIALLAAYANALSMLILIFFRFKAVQIPTRPLLALGFGWLACLPLSVNCLRSAGLSFPLALDARRALRFLPDSSLQKAKHELSAQLDEAMQELEESDAAHGRLADLKRQLAAEAGDGRL